MAMRIDWKANRATQDNAHMQAAVCMVAVAMVSMTFDMVLVAVVYMTLNMVLGPMVVPYAMPPCLGRCPVVLSPMLMHTVVLLPTLMPTVVSQRWSCYT
jgi:hypothetical protein